jgi:hypothetical protein
VTDLTERLRRRAGLSPAALDALLTESLERHERDAAEVARLQAAILKHRHQRGDDRCWLDDDELYAALGDSYVCYRELPAECEFLESCRRYWRQRQTPDERDTPRPECEMTIGQMQEEIPALRAEVAGLSLALAGHAERLAEAERERDALVAASVVFGGFAPAQGHYRYWRIGNRCGDVRAETRDGADAVVRHDVRKALALDAAPTPTVPQDQSSGGVALSHTGAADAPQRGDSERRGASGAEGGES